MKRCTEQPGRGLNLNQAMEIMFPEIKKMDEVNKKIEIKMRLYDDVQKGIRNDIKEIKQDIRRIGKI